MSPLQPTLDIRTNPNNECITFTVYKCSKCKRNKPSTAFPLATRGKGKGKERAATCGECTAVRTQQNQEKKEEKEESLPVISLGHFITVLEGYRAGCAETCNLEARVSTEDLDPTMIEDVRAAVDALVIAVSETLGWRFRLVFLS